MRNASAAAAARMSVRATFSSSRQAGRACATRATAGAARPAKACPRAAIFYTLEASLGGAGGRLYAEDSRDTLTWVLRLADGAEQRITVNKQQANDY